MWLMPAINSKTNKKNNRQNTIMPLRLTLLICLFIVSNTSPAQESVKNELIKTLKQVDPRIDTKTAESLGISAIKEIFSKPDLLNDLFSKNIELLEKKSSTPYKFIRDLNIKPKTFQADSFSVSLGFEYKYENSWTKNKKTGKSLFLQNYDLSFNGDVAFKKKQNPNSFLESSLSYEGAFMWGGQPMKIDDATSDKIQEIEDSILERRERKEPYLDLYQQVNSLITVTDQFYLGVKGKFAFESNQDFTKRQFAPGILIGFGAKGWNKNEALRYLNIFDYPFALIRLLTGTDATFNVYGATFPSFLFGLDYVIPNKDTVRKKLIGNKDPFTRLRLEVGFKTRVARIGKEVIHFISNFRWYQELNPNNAIKINKLDMSTFFVASLESYTGLFISYTAGKLPFDRKNDQVYALGFRYDLGNSKDK